jgi:hypothetical protein
MVECQVSKARLKDPTYSYDGEKEEAMSGNILRAVLTGICCNVALPARGVEHAMSDDTGERGNIRPIIKGGSVFFFLDFFGIHLSAHDHPLTRLSRPRPNQI